ncbi:NERD domain-containing protein [Erythrobacter sp. SCSIO 43205]|uniref:nuclease-related domain-containing protein n=1 Tax=Erythrobacter sp. SCSIO 43205 TaxID=2779361 RepID=UPI001CAA0F13|nr:nuclease-related domain-containing protein [Erythrobacter sp. SCSIO 43205]UAB78286.1 NERD domain-containing protein [Erythrobacter sp. SCSIO 43205]
MQKRRLDKEYANLCSGRKGERDAAYFMNREFGQSKSIGIVHDLRIAVNDEFAQIDHLAIHRLQGRLWLCETKNYGGRLQCNEHGEWTVWYGKKPQPVPSPVSQARRQAIVLERWLKLNGYGYLEVFPLVLLAPTASIDRRKMPEDVTVVKSDQFGEWWERQANELGAMTALKMAAAALWEKRDEAWLRELGDKLCSAHTPITFDWEKRLGLEPTIDPIQEQRANSNVRVLHAAKKQASQDEPDLSTIVSPYGEIKFVALGNSEVAIRNPPVERLIEAVRGTVKGRGRWQPRFKNWIVKRQDFAQVRQQIENKLAASKSERRA